MQDRRWDGFESGVFMHLYKESCHSLLPEATFSISYTKGLNSAWYCALETAQISKEDKRGLVFGRRDVGNSQVPSTNTRGRHHVLCEDGVRYRQDLWVHRSESPFTPQPVRHSLGGWFLFNPPGKMSGSPGTFSGCWITKCLLVASSPQGLGATEIH